MDINIRTILDKIDLREQKQPIFIAVVILITLFAGKKIWNAQKAQSLNFKDKIKNYQKQINLANEINKLSNEFEKFRDAGWLTKESVEIMGRINEIAGTHDIEILQFDPGRLSSKKGYSTMSMSLNIRADYSNLSRFLSEIEEWEALTKITYLRITPEGSHDREYGPMIRVNLSIEAFILEK